MLREGLQQTGVGLAGGGEGASGGSSRGAPRSYTGLKRALVATRESCIPLWEIIGVDGARAVDVLYEA